MDQGDRLLEVELLPHAGRGDCMKPHCGAKNVPVWQLKITPKPEYLPEDPVLVCDMCAIMLVTSKNVQRQGGRQFLTDIVEEG